MDTAVAEERTERPPALTKSLSGKGDRFFEERGTVPFSGEALSNLRGSQDLGQ